MRQWLQQIWYRATPPPRWLRALEAPYRAWMTRRGARPQDTPPVPVVVVGNLTAGGTGKTPLVIYLVELLQQGGWQPAVISRGYGGRPGREPLRVDKTTPATQCGDEPREIAARTGCPVWVCKRRRLALDAAVAAGADVVISDDGLQHRALPRSVEICMIDGTRGFGNGHLLPAGPLREPRARLQSVDFVVCKDTALGLPGELVMQLEPAALVRLRDGARFAPDYLSGNEVQAIAGIGNPEPFFHALGDLGCKVLAHPHPDHHVFSAAELSALPPPVVMTAKDAARLPPTQPREGLWVLEVSVKLPIEFDREIVARVSTAHPGPM